MKTHHIYSDGVITHAQRESAYAEGELAFQQGERRVCNPYAAASPTLEQVWWNGWDHSRRIDKLALTVSWWHGWDTAQEESKNGTTHSIQDEMRARIHVP
jgi:hypothetical protein